MVRHNRRDFLKRRRCRRHGRLRHRRYEGLGANAWGPMIASALPWPASTAGGDRILTATAP